MTEEREFKKIQEKMDRKYQSTNNNAIYVDPMTGNQFLTTERQCPDTPPIFVAGANDVYTNGKPNVQFLKNHFMNQGLLGIEQAKDIIIKATTLLKKEPNVLRVKTPVTSKWI
jgi:hypothetical protein